MQITIRCKPYSSNLILHIACLIREDINSNIHLQADTKNYIILGSNIKNEDMRILIYTFFILSLITPAAFAELNIVDTEAGKAFKSGDYNKAITEFTTLLEQYPDQAPLILRYIGLSYHRLENYQKALETYDKALKIDPENVPIIYYKASTYFKISQTDMARALFDKVKTLAPESLYAKWAGKYVEAIEQQQTEFERPGGPRFYNVFLQIAPQLDFNVPENPNGSGAAFTEDESFRFTEYLNLGLRTTNLGNWVLGANFNTYQSQHTKRELRDFNLSTFNVSPYINYTTTLFGKPFSPTLNYNFNYALLDYDRFSNSHSITASLNTAFTPNTLTIPFYRFAYDDFEDEGFDPAISSRDAVNNSVGLLQYFFFMERALNVWLGYEFQHNNADGLNFNFNGHRLRGGISAPLFWAIRADINGEYGREKYPDFQGPRDRKTDRINFLAMLTRNISGPIYAAMSYSFTNEDSTYRVLEYDRHIITWSLFLSY